MVRTPASRKRKTENTKKNYSLRSGRTIARQTARNSMVSSNVGPKNIAQKTLPSLFMPNESCQVTGKDKSRTQTLVGEEEEVEELQANVQEESDLATSSRAPIAIEGTSNHPSTFGRDLPERILGEIVDTYILKRGVEPPRIPLCRLMENEIVRAVGPGTEALIARFEKSGYSMLGAPFLVAFKKPDHDQQFVSENDIMEWGPIWEEVNREFEANLSPEWHDLQGKKFIVYDENHRLKTWSAVIKTQYSTIKWRHCCVKVQFVHVDRKSQAEFLLALKTQNEIGRTTVCTNFGQEIFLFQKLAMASKESLLQDLPTEWVHWIQVELAREHKATKGTWYNAPAVMLAMLIWKEEFDSHLSKEMVEINDPSIPLQEKMYLARGKTERIFKERAYKMLSIANPANGQGFFSLLYKYNWARDKDLVGLTKDKVLSLATAKLDAERKRDILQTMLQCRLDDVTSERYMSAQKFRFYLRKEWYWECLLKQCLKIKGKLVEELPDGFERWFSSQRKQYLDEAFAELWKQMNTKEADDKIPELVVSSRRVFYRWIVSLLQEKVIHDMPSFIEEWKNTSAEGCMYPLWMKERGLTDWEVEFCPWWLDFPVGTCPHQEEELYEEHGNKEIEESDEGGSISKQTSRSKKTQSIQGRGEDVGNVSQSAMSSIQKRLEFMEKRTPQRKSRKATKRRNNTEIIVDVAANILGQKKTRIASTTSNILKMNEDDGKRFAEFLEGVNVQGLCLNGERSNTVASLFFADFPTGCFVEPSSIDMVPSWNEFSPKLSKKVALLASSFVADNGWYITLCATNHFGTICSHADISGFKLKHTILLLILEGYLRSSAHERVEVLILGMFYRKGNRPIYDREMGESVDKKAFDAHSCMLVEQESGHFIGERKMRGPAERSLDFFRWLVMTFTVEETTIIDIFAGCGGLGIASVERNRHCLCVDYDQTIFDQFLARFNDASEMPKQAELEEDVENTDSDDYEP